MRSFTTEEKLKAIELAEKARLDGGCVMNESFAFDMKCFFGTVGKIAEDDSIV